MQDTHAKFYSRNGKRRLLVVDDEEINREILNEILSSQYEVVLAEDGLKAIELLRQQKDLISLVVLDLIMPKMSGKEVLREIRSCDDYRDIPVIVASGDQASEIECLNAGASDFIQKPYPEPGIILARVLRAIELFENRRTIESTERDDLTGLYTADFFYNYAGEYDTHHKDIPMDAIVININQFGIINERYGKEYADSLLKRIAEASKKIVQTTGGLVCRRDADIFYIYCPHREDYKTIIESVSHSITDDNSTAGRIRLRMGVYANADKELGMERRFDRAKMAADSVRNNLARNIGIFDDNLHKAELYSQKLVEDFQTAIAENQFMVYFQPKFEILDDTPRLYGAEALVRWQHPELGMISPGVFVPLFEHNGLIQTLDHFVWNEAARHIGIWKTECGVSVPVSVNVSRIDMYDPDIVYKLLSILEANRLEAADLHLEITESAYAEDSEKIIEVVKTLRSIGFRIEMDDFGTGYSSLNMLSSLPIDLLKLDMKFIQAAALSGDMHMISIIVEIAKHLSVPVVAEGVETDEQLDMLRKVGCEIVQGYYFSAPVPPEKFRPFLEQKKEYDRSAQETVESYRQKPEGFAKGLKERFSDWSRKLNIPMRAARNVCILASVLTALALFMTDSAVTNGYRLNELNTSNYILARQAADELEIASDYLTDRVRSFVLSGDIGYLKDYFEEAETTKRRDHAISDLETLHGSGNDSAYDYLSKALDLSNELMGLEYRAMCYILRTGDYNASDIPLILKAFPLSSEEKILSSSELRARAAELVCGDEYNDYKARIIENTDLCTNALIDMAEQDRIVSEQRMDSLLRLRTVLTVFMLIVMLATIFFIYVWVHLPLEHMVDYMKAGEMIPPSGARELRFVSDTYNMIFEENRLTNNRLTFDNLHDSLTGLYNRNAYDLMKKDIDMTHNGLVLIDVDKFKSINDIYGHDVGDKILVRVADILKYNFRDTDLAFRIGGDEFVVIMSNPDTAMRRQLKPAIDQANIMLQKPNDDLPPVSISAGAAFGDRRNAEGDIFQDADTALYRVKNSGRCGCEIF